MNKLTLFCGGVEVGTCEFDLGAYVGKDPVPEAAGMRALDYVGRGGKNYLRGSDAAAWPGAEIQFRITVKPPEGQPAADAVSAAGSVL